jgi:hypothetical protein
MNLLFAICGVHLHGLDHVQTRQIRRRGVDPFSTVSKEEAAHFPLEAPNVGQTTKNVHVHVLHTGR